MNNQEYWKNLSKPYLVDSVLLSVVREQSKLVTFAHTNMKNDEPVLYDIYGLSYYARLAIFTLNFIKELGVQVFFKKDASGVRSRLWIINELILVQNILNNSNLLKKTTNAITSMESLQADSFQYDINQIIESITAKDKHTTIEETDEESEGDKLKEKETAGEVEKEEEKEEKEEEDDDDNDEEDEEEMADMYWDTITELINFDETVEVANHDTTIILIANAFNNIKESGYPYASVFNSLLDYAQNKYELSEERAEILLSEVIEPTIFINGKNKKKL